MPTITGYPAYSVTYQDSRGNVRAATLRIREDVSDLAADARRQITGNRLSVAEILAVRLDVPPEPGVAQ